MKNGKYNILVLTDLTDSTNSVLKTAVTLAKSINATTQLFYVKKPTDIVESDSQLSTLRIINEQHTLTKRKLQDLADSLYETYNQKIDFNYAFGNVKAEIGDYIKKNNPDIVILGKRTPKLINFIRDGLTDFLLKTYRGIILIVGTENRLDPNHQFSLGILNDFGFSKDKEFINTIFKNAQKPLKKFGTTERLNTKSNESILSDSKTVEYVFEKSPNSIKNLANYLSKSNINLLLMDRYDNKDTQQRNLKDLDIKGVINKLNVSLLISSC